MILAVLSSEWPLSGQLEPNPGHWAFPTPVSQALLSLQGTVWGDIQSFGWRGPRWVLLGFGEAAAATQGSGHADRGRESRCSWGSAWGIRGLVIQHV